MAKEPHNRALSDAELEAQEAIDLPDREALSLLGTGGTLGGIPLGGTDPTSGTAAPTDPSSTASPTAAPTTMPTTGDPTGLADRLSSVQGKFVG